MRQQHKQRDNLNTPEFSISKNGEDKCKFNWIHFDSSQIGFVAGCLFGIGNILWLLYANMLNRLSPVWPSFKRFSSWTNQINTVTKRLSVCFCCVFLNSGYHKLCMHNNRLIASIRTALRLVARAELLR